MLPPRPTAPSAASGGPRPVHNAGQARSSGSCSGRERIEIRRPDPRSERPAEEATAAHDAPFIAGRRESGPRRSELATSSKKGTRPRRRAGPSPAPRPPACAAEAGRRDEPPSGPLGTARQKSAESESVIAEISGLPDSAWSAKSPAKARRSFVGCEPAHARGPRAPAEGEAPEMVPEGRRAKRRKTGRRECRGSLGEPRPARRLLLPETRGFLSAATQSEQEKRPPGERRRRKEKEEPRRIEHAGLEVREPGLAAAGKRVPERELAAQEPVGRVELQGEEEVSLVAKAGCEPSESREEPVNGNGGQTERPPRAIGQAPRAASRGLAKRRRTLLTAFPATARRCRW